jgi:hypothetical protein
MQMRWNAVLIRAVQAVLALALAALCALWLWKLAGPREVARAPAIDAAGAGVDLVAAGRSFGVPPVQAKSAPEANALADVILKGIYRTREGEGGFVVVQIGNQPPRAIFAGAEIKPGLKLSHLEPDHAVFVREGAEAKIALPARPKLVQPAPKSR